jgi:IS30 family transposase
VAPLLTREQKGMAFRLRNEGMDWKEIARACGCSVDSIDYLDRRLPTDVGIRIDRGSPPFDWVPAPGRLTIHDREEIVVGLARGESFCAIARRLKRAPSTISREVGANGGRDDYRAWGAHLSAQERARRPKPTKLASNPELLAEVIGALAEFWSPEEIARRLRLDHPDDPMMQVSHETIYQSLYVQGRGELRRELARCLRTKRAHRRPQGATRNQGKIPGMVMISERPAEVEDRAVPGHWEGDLIIGKNNRSAVGTLVERSTRFVLLLHLPEGRDASSVKAAMMRAIATLPARLVKTITWDQGKEMARHLEFTVETDIPVYFCDPHSPWQRGSNENTNGLLRQYMPKSTDLSVHTAEDLDRIATSLNNRPRKTLGYLKPSEKLAELIAQTG